MEKIDGVDLGNLVSDVAAGIVTDRRNQASGLIKQQLQKVEQLAKDIVAAEKDLEKKKGKLTQAQGKIDKIKAGDWTVLTELAKQNKGNKKDNDCCKS